MVIVVSAMPKCPLCKNNMPKKEVSLRLKSLMLSVSPTLTKSINKVFNIIDSNWNLKDVEKCAFFARIEHIEESIVIKMINVFINKGYAEGGHSIAYLSGMIERENKQQKFKNEYERKKLDRLPPKLKD